MTDYEIIKLLHILVGGTEPVGETNIDHQCLINVLKLREITEACIENLADAAVHINRPEASMKEVASEARNALIEYKAFINRVIGEDNE